MMMFLRVGLSHGGLIIVRLVAVVVFARVSHVRVHSDVKPALAAKWLKQRVRGSRKDSAPIKALETHNIISRSRPCGLG
jgi:hypothetical protein